MKFIQVVFSLFAIGFLCACQDKIKEVEFAEVLPSEKINKKAELIYGFPLEEYFVERDTIKRGDNLSLILARHNYDATEIHQIVESIKDSFDYRRIRAGNTFTLLKSKDAIPRLEIMIYEPDKTGFQVIDFRDSIHTYKI